MGISVAMIVKNEEDCIDRALGSVLKFADEVVVVDTGSTDRTREIAERPGVRVFDSEHFDKDTHYSDFSFSVARNESIGHCTQDWVCWWDADDVIDDAGAAKIKEISEKETRECLYSFQIAFGALKFHHCRMFRSGRNISFDETHSCHEYLSSRGHPTFVRNDVVIQHLPGKKGVASNIRNLAILEKDCFERGHKDQRTLFYLANSYRECGKCEEAIKFYDEYLKISAWPEERFFARFYKAQCWAQMGKMERSRDVAFECLKEDYRFAEPYCLLGDICFTQGDFKRARSWYQLAFDTSRPQTALLFVTEPMYKEYPQQRIRDCARKLKKADGKGKDEKESLVPKKKSRAVTFNLPDDRGRAFEAVSAAVVYGRQAGVKVEAVAKDDWARELVEMVEGLAVGEDDGMEMELPPSCGSKHAVEWYCRSAGILPKELVSAEISGIDREPKRGLVAVGGGDWSGWGGLRRRLSDSGMELLDVDEDWSPAKAVGAMAKAEVFVGEAGWLHHLAKSMEVPAVVLWNGSRPENHGWPEQENRGQDISEEDVFGLVRRVSNGC